MEYNDVIRNKNKILAITLLICIVLRCIVNAFFLEVAQVIPMGIGGLVFTALLLFLNNRIHPVAMMYAMVVLMSAISVALMIAFPCTTNYLMFFLAIFFVVIYEDIRPIVLQSSVSAIAMVYFYFRYTKELQESWSLDAMAMCVVYIVSGMLVYISLCRLTKEQFTKLQKTHKKSEKERKKAEELEEKLRSAYSEVIWTSVKVYGTKMTVELQENLLPEEEYEAKDDTPEDIVAKKDGVISSMVTRTGTPLVTADMEVKKGDILVSGRAEILNDDGEVAEYIYPGADADIIAEVNFYYEDEINISYQDKIKTGRAKKDYGIRFFDYHLKNPIFRQDYEQFDLTEHASQLHFTDNFYLPVYFETYLYEECQTEEKTYSKTEAAAIAQSRFEQYLTNLEEKGIQILEKNVMIEKADQKYVVTGTVDAYESIVSYQPTEILEITSEERQQPNESD